MGRLFGTDGVRGIANDELTCELALSIGRATAAILKNGRGKRPLVMVGGDTRISTDMLANGVMAGLCSMGADVMYLGVVATPAVAYLVRKYGADAGIMISASHNPSEYNGIKIFSGDGFKLPDALEDQIEAMILMPDKYLHSSSDSVGKIIYSEKCISDYCEYLRSTASAELSGLKIAIDCSNGSASRTAPELFRALGAEVTVLSAAPDGYNINKDCGSTHIEALSELVVKNSLDAGFAFDGDADRCLCVDERGSLVDGDQILAVCSLDLKKRGLLKNGTVVGTVMTNFGFTEFCRKNGINFIPTKVGDRYVLEEMNLGEYKLGGEQSGHIIFRDFATTGDGQLTAIQVLSLMSRSKKSLSELTSVMKRAPQELINLKVSAEGKLRFYTDPDIKAAIKAADAELGETGRLVVRPSGTEPLIRVMTEGSDKELIARIAKSVADTIMKALV